MLRVLAIIEELPGLSKVENNGSTGSRAVSLSIFGRIDEVAANKREKVNIVQHNLVGRSLSSTTTTTTRRPLTVVQRELSGNF
jgi:hypothetical protein